MYTTIAALALTGILGVEGLTIPSTAGFKFPRLTRSRGGQSQCVSGTVSVQASTASNVQIDYPLPVNQTQVTETTLDYITPGANFPTSILGEPQTVEGTYNLGATLCMPSGSNVKGVQLLTHGVGFDRYYWDFTSEYSYVDRAAQAGYATFFYDRLGVGQSEKPDAVETVQTGLEIEIARTLAQSLRKGEFARKSFETVVGVGHSFGSIITEAITASTPSTFDAAILTGFSVDTAGIAPFITGLNLAIAKENSPFRFPFLSTGYLVSSNIISQQTGFFRAPGFSPDILRRAETTKQTFTVGELFTLAQAIRPATAYSNPVAVVNGDADLPFCFGDCARDDKAQAVRGALYPALPETKFGTYLAPQAGHGLNLHYSASGAFDWIMEFLEQQGL
ncbi:alpha/beta-hydrolase [Hortaea werneckii]|nr:alpha/beta-hydrolase [Hortaea werneckii]